MLPGTELEAAVGCVAQRQEMEKRGVNKHKLVHLLLFYLCKSICSASSETIENIVCLCVCVCAFLLKGQCIYQPAWHQVAPQTWEGFVQLKLCNIAAEPLAGLCLSATCSTSMCVCSFKADPYHVSPAVWVWLCKQVAERKESGYIWRLYLRFLLLCCLSIALSFMTFYWSIASQIVRVLYSKSDGQGKHDYSDGFMTIIIYVYC